jgi:hypothetical protein
MAAKETKSGAKTSLNFGQNVKKMRLDQRRPNAEQRHPQPISNGIRSAISDLWPGGIPAHLMAKERDEQIKKWLQDNNKKISVNISRTIQRVLEAKRKTHPD